MAGVRVYEKLAELLFVWALTTSDPKLVRRLRECAFDLLALANSSDDDINRMIQQSWDDVQAMHRQQSTKLEGMPKSNQTFITKNKKERIK